MRTGTVQRAFQLAPECETIEEIRVRLAKEGCDNVSAHMQGVLVKQLKGLLRPSAIDAGHTQRPNARA